MRQCTPYGRHGHTRQVLWPHGSYWKGPNILNSIHFSISLPGCYPVIKLTAFEFVVGSYLDLFGDGPKDFQDHSHWFPVPSLASWEFLRVVFSILFILFVVGHHHPCDESSYPFWHFSLIHLRPPLSSYRSRFTHRHSKAMGPRRSFRPFPESVRQAASCASFYWACGSRLAAECKAEVIQRQHTLRQRT